MPGIFVCAAHVISCLTLNLQLRIIAFYQLKWIALHLNENIDRVPMIQIDKITIAVGRMEEMRRFYAAVFGVDFKPLDLYGNKLYSGLIEDLEVLLCPKELAGVQADVNTIQLRFVVSNIKQAVETGMQHGGTMLSEIREQGGALLAALRDPDGNSIEFIQT